MFKPKDSDMLLWLLLFYFTLTETIATCIYCMQIHCSRRLDWYPY